MGTVASEFGAVDILVNNAVVRHAAPVEDFGTQAWDDALLASERAGVDMAGIVAQPCRPRRNDGTPNAAARTFGGWSRDELPPGLAW